MTAEEMRLALRGEVFRWKRQLLDSLLDFEAAKKVLDALRRIHEHSSRDPVILEAFADNSIFYDLCISTYIEKTIRIHPELKNQSLPVVMRLRKEKTVPNHYSVFANS